MNGKDTGGSCRTALLNVKKLRNCISHNRIVLEEDYNALFNSLYLVLPETYRKGFKKDLIDTRKDLSVNEKWYWEHLA